MGPAAGVAAAWRDSRPIPDWKDYILFHEYFHGDNGAGLGASRIRPVGPA